MLDKEFADALDLVEAVHDLRRRMLSLGEDVETVADGPTQSWSFAEPCTEGADVVNARGRFVEQRGLTKKTKCEQVRETGGVRCLGGSSVAVDVCFMLRRCVGGG